MIFRLPPLVRKTCSTLGDILFTMYIRGDRPSKRYASPWVPSALNQSVRALEMSDDHAMVAKQLATTLMFSAPSVTALSNSRLRRASNKNERKVSGRHHQGRYWTQGRGPTSVSAGASISEGGEGSDSAERAMPPTVRYCGGMHSWWRRTRYTGVWGARKRTMYAVMSSHRPRVHPRDG